MERFIAGLAAAMLLTACGGGGTVSHVNPPTTAYDAVGALQWVGANVGMAEISPLAFDYVQTDQGDLFDIAHKAGLNISRVVDWMPSATYGAADWAAIRQRALATNIALIPVLAQYTGDTSNAQAEALFVSECESKADMILGQAGLAQSPSLAFVDIVNEPVLNGWIPRALAEISTYIHARYPGVHVTVGGWFPALPAGAALTSIVDLWAPHLYDANGVSFNDMPASQETQDVVADLRLVAGFANGNAMVVEEFGTPSGLLAAGDGNTKTPGSPQSQAAHTAAMIAGIQAARASGVPVTGAVEWNLYPGYGQNGWFEAPNADAIIVPQGLGKALQVMPAVLELCKASGDACTGAQQLLKTPPIQK